MSKGVGISIRQRGFTIVELLIVIVVIGILAAIVIVAFNGVQDRAKTTSKINDIRSMQKAIELYYTHMVVTQIRLAPGGFRGQLAMTLFPV